MVQGQFENGGAHDKGSIMVLQKLLEATIGIVCHGLAKRPLVNGDRLSSGIVFFEKRGGNERLSVQPAAEIDSNNKR